MADVMVRFSEGKQSGSGNYAFWLCQGWGWVAFKEWVAGLTKSVKPGYSEKAWPKLNDLVNTGKADDTGKLADELSKASHAFPPEGTAAVVLDSLVYKVGMGDEDESITVVQEQDE